MPTWMGITAETQPMILSLTVSLTTSSDQKNFAISPFAVRGLVSNLHANTLRITINVLYICSYEYVCIVGISLILFVNVLMYSSS